jgi:hypothetical protein
VPGTDPVADRHVIERHGERMVIAPVPSAAAAPDAARALAAEGVQLIELCGGFTLAAAAAVADAVGDRVAVGHVTFTVESLPAAAAFATTTDAARA